MKKSSIGVVLAACLLGLSGCADNKNALDNRTNISVKDVRNQGGRVLNDVNNGRLRVSTKAARNVARLNEVDQAHVIIRNNDAYVAVRLKNGYTNRTGTNTAGRTGTPRATGYGDNNMGTTGYSGTTGTTGMTGTASTGQFGTNAGTANITGPGVNSGLYGNRAGVGNTGTSLNRIHPGTYDNAGTTGITNIYGNGVNAGTAGTNNRKVITGNTGTNAANNQVGTTGYSEVSSPLEKKIADKVRAADPSIHKVYVSINPDFYNRMNTYYNDLTNGRNRDGLINDFGNTVRRFFR